MAQLVTRVPDAVAAAVDELVGTGAVASRSDAVRSGLELLLDRHRREAQGRAIVEAYSRHPQPEGRHAWPDAATRAMIADEPW